MVLSFVRCSKILMSIYTEHNNWLLGISCRVCWGWTVLDGRASVDVVPLR